MKKRYTIQQASEDQLDVSQLIKLKKINEELVQRTMDLDNSAEYRDAMEVIKKAEQDVIPRVENHADRQELEDLCRQVRQALNTGDRKKVEEAAPNSTTGCSTTPTCCNGGEGQLAT